MAKLITTVRYLCEGAIWRAGVTQ